MADIKLSGAGDQVNVTPSGSAPPSKYSPVVKSLHTCSPGVNGHANPPGNSYAPFTQLLVPGTQLVRMDTTTPFHWDADYGRAPYTSTTSWTGQNGLRDELAREWAIGITPTPLSASPQFNDYGGNKALFQEFLSQLAAAISPYTPYLMLSNENVNDTRPPGQDVRVAAWLDLFSSIIPAVRARAPGLITVGPEGTWGGGNIAFAKALWNDPRMSQICDVNSFHLYDANRTPEQMHTGGLLRDFADACRTDRPNWCTECGYELDFPAVTPNTHAGIGKLYSRLGFMFACYGFNAFFLYQLIDDGTSETFGLYGPDRQIREEGRVCSTVFPHISAATDFRLYTPNSTWYNCKMHTRSGERLATWALTQRTVFLQVMAQSAGTLQIQTSGGTSQIVQLVPGSNSISVLTDDTSRVLYSTDTVISFPEFGD